MKDHLILAIDNNDKIRNLNLKKINIFPGHQKKYSIRQRNIYALLLEQTYLYLTYLNVYI